MTRGERVRAPGWMRTSWEHFGATDPMWAILTQPETRDGRWDADAFFATGRADCAELLARATRLHPSLGRGNALDFGCGLGRLTRPLADEFEHAVGIDIAVSMIERANAHNHAPSRCSFLQCCDTRLPVASQHFDFVVSKLTLQHIPPRLGLAYLGDLARTVAPGGLLLVQIPTGSRRRLLRRVGLTARRLAHRLWNHGIRRRPIMGVWAIQEARVRTALESAGLTVLAVEPEDSVGPDWDSAWYAATRRDY